MKNKFLKYIVVVVLLSGCFVFAQDDSAAKGEEVYKKRCFGCHGSAGDIKAFGVSRKLIDLSAKDVAERLKTLSDKKMQGVGGASGTMHKQISAVSKEEYEAVLSYVTFTFAKKDADDSSNVSEQEKNTTKASSSSQGQLKMVVTPNGTTVSQ
ncbi:MAG: cytochrome c [Campylobacteraceae bacterium]|jgi:mono/diheme cytochrome c family protein|nr:cytochrome c [Campylobacteraceae bacterium]